MARLGWVLAWGLCAVSVCLVLGLPLYGLVEVLRTGVDPFTRDVGPGGLLVVLGLGLGESLVLAGLLWAAERRWFR